MQRIGVQAGRVFKALAGQDRDKPVGPYVIALYGYLFLIAMVLLLAWITGTPAECVAGAEC
jgi:hypothetical protein